ncbi:hypothetical protein A2680_00495 [Candidatus Kaiserbacteria bacterium RIFCSPHIGHO2_01_FULL_55_37]|nr:MAG: hypothetical protein A2680_00495 [Candidatus Kaiserbacteria bacterium RIFCSPHIGHO2_01_FULL_55_37]
MNTRAYMLGAALLVAVQASVLFLFGQPAICTCGYVKLWEGVVLSAGNSQHLTDWYTFSHIIHGILFYALFTFLFPRISVWARLLMAMGVEIAWEIAENTPTVIQHYREQALAQGYTGDSIINSVSDTVAMVAGFLAARKWPVWSVIALALFLELWVAYEIRDNLTLNIVNLLHQFDFIAAWQSGT